MKRCIRTVVLFFGLLFVFWQGYALPAAEDVNKNPLAAKSIEELSLLIEKALTEKNVQKLEEIKKSNLELIRGNLSLTVQKCNTLLDEGIKNELSGERQKGELNFKIARVMAEIYQRAYDNSYLLDKVDLFSRWNKEEKEKYMEAEKFYAQGEDDYEKYNYERAVISYSQSLSLFREVGYREGEAKIHQRLGNVHYQSDEYKKARERYEQGLAIFREIKDRLGEADTLRSLGDVHYQLDEYEKARERYENGLAIFCKIKHRLGEANTLRSLGDLHLRLSENEKARESYEQGLAIYREIKSRLGEANTLSSLGDMYLQLSEYDKARERYEECLPIYREIKARLGEVNCLQSLGDVHLQLSEYEKARERYEQCLVIVREIKDRLGEANILRHFGILYIYLSEYDKARQMLKEGLTIYREIKSRIGEANCLKSFGDVYIQLSEYEQARRSYEQGLAIFREIKERLGEVQSIWGLGEVHFRLSENEKARNSFEELLKICREIKARLSEAVSLQRLGDVYISLSNYEQARQRIYEGLAIYREIKDRLGEANCLKSLGDVHYQLAEYEKAGEKYEEGLAIYREIKDSLGEGNTLYSLGDVSVMLNEYEKARERYEQGLAIYREIKDRLGEANCLKSLGDVYLRFSEYEKARQRIEEGLAIYREIKDTFGEANTLRSLGDVHRLLNELKKARRIYEEALSIQKEIGDRYGKCQSYSGLGQTFAAMNNFSAAEKEYINSIETIEEVWEEMKREEFKAPYLSSQISPYESLIRLLFNQGKGKLAFSYAERSKARSFLYLLGNKRIDIKKGVPLNLVRQEEELRQKIAGHTRKIMENEEKEPARRSSSAQLNNELLQLKQTHSEILGKIKLQCPEFAGMIAINPLSLNEIQTLIHAAGDTVFLEYYTTPDAAYLWVLDGKNIFPYKIDIDNDTLDKKAREFYYMISNPSFGIATLEFQAQALYDLLLKPAEKHWAGKTRVGVIPHGVLHYLPFEALMNNGKFLMEQDIKFFYLPSASVYKFCRDKNPLKKEQLIALGNPDGSLVWAENEVKEIKSLFKLNPKIYVGNEATETRVKTEGPSADILHLSCHGVFDSAHPMYSALKLAGDEKEDGNLEVQDIFQLELKPAYLVTLSACETHKGSIKAGDEIVVMSRAFIYAGTPSIVASLWNVNPNSTEKLMVSFYRELKKKDKLEALHAARKDMIEKQGKHHPFYWAPFVLIGDFR